MFVFRKSRDRRDRPSRGGPTARVLKRPNRPEPVMGPRPSAVFSSSFFPPAYYLGSLDGSNRNFHGSFKLNRALLFSLKNDSRFLCESYIIESVEN
jgi:hypothetical protein